MGIYRADLHIHSVLSPCGDLEMSPVQIIHQAKLLGLPIIGITDHNSTKHVTICQRLAQKEGIFVLGGAEITSIEEVHALCFMPNTKQLAHLQAYIDEHLIKTPHNPTYFGEQLLVNEKEEILGEEVYLLINSLNKSIDEISEFVHQHHGIFIPAHIDRPAFSLISQLGFIPPQLNYDALELSIHGSSKKILENEILPQKVSFIQSSDAHYLQDIGRVFTEFHLNKVSFEEIKWALNQQKGCHCRIAPINH